MKVIFKKFIAIILLVILIISNAYYIFYYDKYIVANHKEIKTTTKYVKDKDDYSFNSIHNCIESVLFYLEEENSEAILDLLDSEFIKSNNISKYNVDSLFSNISYISVQESYKSTNKNGSIHYVSTIVERNKKLESMFLIVKRDYNNDTYSLSITDDKTYNKAKKNKVAQVTNIIIPKNQYNQYEYSSDIGELCYRYINDYYLKYTYVPKEAYKLVDSKYVSYNNYLQSREKVEKIDIEDILALNKEINDGSIIYDVLTTNKSYKIIVYSPMNYKIKIY